MSRFEFRLADLGEGTAEAEIVAWLVAAGDTVGEDQPMVEVMTDKATVEITSPVEGRVLSLSGEPGDMAAVGSVLVVLEVRGDGRDAASRGPDPAVQVHEPAEMEVRSPEPDMLGQGDYLFRLPDVGEGVVEAEIVAWHVKPGDEVAEEQPLVDVMTDKATVEITSPVSGRIVSLAGEPGASAAVGSTLVVFSTAGKVVAPSRAASQEPAIPAGPVLKPFAVASDSATARAIKPLASPAVRRRAEALQLDLVGVRGSGADGRISHQDLDGLIGGRLQPPRTGAGGGALYAERTGVEEVKVIGLRRKIAEKMQESKRRIPHFAYVEEVDVTELEALRAHLNGPKSGGRPKLTLLPFLIRALVGALPGHPQINATFDDDAGLVCRHQAVHLGMATQTAQGLVVPVIRHAEARDLWDLAEEIARLAAATRDGTASREELSGSTITLTSLGPLGGVAHTPVINRPEVAIIGPNNIIERPVVRQGQIVVRKMMNLSSSFDHRVVDGFGAAEFIQTVKGLLEHPATLFLG